LPAEDAALRRERWFQYVTFALLLAQGCAWAATPVSSQAAAFDTLFERLDGGEVATLSAGQLTQRLTELQRLVPPGDVLRELRYRSMHCNWNFDNDARGQLASAQDGLARAQRVDDAELQARFHYCRAAAQGQLGTTADTLADYEAGIALSRKSENDRLLADGLGARGGMRSLLGEQARAIPDMLAAQRLYQRAGAGNDAESMLLDLAIAYRRIGDLDKAREYLHQNEIFASRLGDWNQLTSNLMQQGYLNEDLGRVDDALDAYRRVLALAKSNSSQYTLGGAHLAMAYPYVLKQQYRQALEMLDHAQAEFAAVGDTSNQCMIDLRRGQAHAGLGQHQRALGEYDRAVTAIERSGNLRYLAMLYQARAASLEALDQDDAALADLKRYIELDERISRDQHDQQAQWLHYQFDTGRRDLENRRLIREKALGEQQVATLLQARRWQWVAMALGGVLLLLLGALVMRQLARMQRLRELASTDALTGVANRRSIDRLGADAIAHARAAGEGFTALTFDIDYFKRVNDSFGHLTGDQVLARIANACQGALRQFDLLGRTGGEEFLVLLPNTRMEQAQPIAERLRAAVAAIDFSDISEDLTVTISIGMAELVAADVDLKALMHRADNALYRAKADGRNRVEVEA
jgi:diguanylate cyclase (GGDEF)-like protein